VALSRHFSTSPNLPRAGPTPPDPGWRGKMTPGVQSRTAKEHALAVAKGARYRARSFDQRTTRAADARSDSRASELGAGHVAGHHRGAVGRRRRRGLAEPVRRKRPGAANGNAPAARATALHVLHAERRPALPVLRDDHELRVACTRRRVEFH